jgi:hypothetical protein
MQTVHVPSFGLSAAKPASELVVGDVIVHSFGEKSDVLEIVKETEKSIVVRIREHHKSFRNPNGYECEKRYSKKSLVPVKN